MNKPPPDTSELYKVLGVPKTATTAEMKKAYRKKSLIMHPDRGGTEADFKKLNEAWETLGDAEKRKTYDREGMEGVKMKEQMGSQQDMMDMLQGRKSRRGKKKTPNLTHRLKVSLEDLYLGRNKRIALRRNQICEKCDGEGTTVQGASVTCTTCRGKGQVLKMKQLGRGMMQQMQTACPACQGSGSGIREQDKCRNCYGKGTQQERKVISINIVAGSENGTKMVYGREADEKPGHIAGDLHVFLDQQPHPLFRRDGDTLFYEKTISIREAICGFRFPIRHLDNRTIWVQSNPNSQSCIQNGDRIQIDKEGFPKTIDRHENGDLIIEFKVEFPKRMSKEERQALSQVLPGREPPPLPPNERVTEWAWFDEDYFEQERKKRKAELDAEKKERKKNYAKSETSEDEEEASQRRQQQSPFGQFGQQGGPGGQQMHCTHQ